MAYPQNFTNEFRRKTLRERLFDGRQGDNEFEPLMLPQPEGRRNFSEVQPYPDPATINVSAVSLYRLI